MTACEYIEWGTRFNAITACDECGSQGYSDYGIAEKVIVDARFDENFYEAKKELIDSIYEIAHLDIKQSGNALVAKVLKNYCTGNIDTSYRLIGTDVTQGIDIATNVKVSPLYRVLSKDSTGEDPKWYELVRVYENTGW